MHPQLHVIFLFFSQNLKGSGNAALDEIKNVATQVGVDKAGQELKKGTCAFLLLTCNEYHVTCTLIYVQQVSTLNKYLVP